MERLNSKDVEYMYSDLVKPNQVLVSAMGNILLAILEGVQETAKAAVFQALQEAQENQDKKEEQ